MSKKIKELLEERQDFVKQWLDDGKTMSALGKEFKCSVCMVSEFCRARGWKSSKRHNSGKYGDMEQYKDWVIKSYNSGLSAKKIAAKIPPSEDTVIRWLNKWGINTARTKPLLKDMYKEVIDMYVNQGLTVYKIARKLGYSDRHVNALLRKHGVDVETDRVTKYKCDETFFDKMDTPDKAYAFGLYVADGYTTDKGIGIELQVDDKKIVENFKKVIKYTGPIMNRVKNHDVWSDTVILNINRVALKAAMERVGCCQNKTFNIKFPSSHIVKTDLMSFFLSGFIMGDGCISKKNNSKFIQFTGNYYFISGIRDFVQKKLNIKESTFTQKHIHVSEGRKKEDSTFILVYSRKADWIPLGKYIYQNPEKCSFFPHDRKYKQFCELLANTKY